MIRAHHPLTKGRGFDPRLRYESGSAVSFFEVPPI